MKGWPWALSTASEPWLWAPYMPTTVLLPLNQGGGGGDVGGWQVGAKKEVEEQSGVVVFFNTSVALRRANSNA